MVKVVDKVFGLESNKDKSEIVKKSEVFLWNYFISVITRACVIPC